MDTHQGHTIFLDSVELGHIIRSGGNPPKDIVKNLRKILKTLFNNAENCKTCGGLTPELQLTWKGKTFSFTCFEIKDEKGKVLAETDYKQFGKWCKKRYGDS